MSNVDHAATEFVHHSIPFAAELGVRIVSSSPTEVVAECDHAPERCTAGGILHGGYLMAVADTIGALLAYHNLPAGANTATIESKTNFLRAANSGITATATTVHVGSSTIVVQTDITREDGKLVSRTTQSQIVIAPR